MALLLFLDLKGGMVRKTAVDPGVPSRITAVKRDRYRYPAVTGKKGTGE